MSTTALTHEAISQALAENAPLTHDQRAALLGLVARDKQRQHERDSLVEALKKDLAELRNGKPYGRCTICGPAEDVNFVFKHLPDVDGA